MEFVENLKKKFTLHYRNSICFEFVPVHEIWISGRDKKYSNLIGVLGKTLTDTVTKGRARKNPVFGWMESSLLKRLISFPTSHASVSVSGLRPAPSQCKRQIYLECTQSNSCNDESSENPKNNYRASHIVHR